MPISTIILGIVLVAIGVIGYVHGVMNDKASITALIPAFFGIVIAILGAGAQMSDALRKHLMHAAVAIALIGFILTAGRLMMTFSELSMSAAVISQFSMSLVCLLSVVLGIRSFAEARRNRSSE